MTISSEVPFSGRSWGGSQFHKNLIGCVQVSIDHNTQLYTSSHGIAKHCHVISCDENALLYMHQEHKM